MAARAVADAGLLKAAGAARRHAHQKGGLRVCALRGLRQGRTQRRVRTVQRQLRRLRRLGQSHAHRGDRDAELAPLHPLENPRVCPTPCGFDGWRHANKDATGCAVAEVALVMRPRLRRRDAANGAGRPKATRPLLLCFPSLAHKGLSLRPQRRLGLRLRGGVLLRGQPLAD
eukprot:235178-Chlamydomonas_euryale.AAC.9